MSLSFSPLLSRESIELCISERITYLKYYLLCQCDIWSSSSRVIVKLRVKCEGPDIMFVLGFPSHHPPPPDNLFELQQLEECRLDLTENLFSGLEPTDGIGDGLRQDDKANVRNLHVWRRLNEFKSDIKGEKKNIEKEVLRVES